MVSRTLYLLFTFLVLEFLLPGGEVKVSMDTPATVDAGKTFRVSITLTKKDLAGFSRFAQDIPAGLTAVANNTANADFTFKDNRVRFIWLKLPDQDTFTISYDVKVDERLKGTFDLAGKFSYIDNNERKAVDVSGRQITIQPASTIDPKLIVDIRDFKERAAPELLASNGEDVACIRQKPDLTYSDKEILVNILVDKGSRQKFAKIEEQVPPGYVAVAVDKKDAIFAFRDQVAKFLWMTLPSDPYFTVSYKLVPQNKNKVDTLNITGSFSYIEGQKNSSVPIVEEDVALENLNKDQLGKILALLPGYMAKQKANLLAQHTDSTKTTGQLAQVNPDKNTQQVKTGNQVVSTNNTVKTIGPADTSKTKLLAVQGNRARDNGSLALLLEPETGVYYRVQIAAGHKPVPIRRYFRKLTFYGDIKTEQQNGWFKYSIGSWTKYRQARDFRLHVWTTTPIKDAFVAAYNKGKRITVQEALMISEQKWYR